MTLPNGSHWVSDPGHGWLVILLDGSHEASMAKAIAEASRCSWVRDAQAWLEEDCDAPAFCTAAVVSRDEVNALPETHIDRVRRM